MSYHFPFAVTYSPQSTFGVDTSRVLNSRVALCNKTFQKPVTSVRTWETSYAVAAWFDRLIKDAMKTSWFGSLFRITGHLLGIHRSQTMIYINVRMWDGNKGGAWYHYMETLIILLDDLPSQKASNPVFLYFVLRAVQCQLSIFVNSLTILRRDCKLYMNK